VASDITRNLAAAGRMADMDRVLEVKFADQLRRGRIGVRRFSSGRTGLGATLDKHRHRIFSLESPQRAEAAPREGYETGVEK
jgi:hypothetical protein